MLINILSQNGVDISHISKINAKNGHAIIQVSAAGENSIFLYPGSNEMVSKEYIDFVLENFSNSSSPKDGMEKSYDEIFKILSLLDEKVDVFKGAEKYLDNENTPVISPIPTYDNFYATDYNSYPMRYVYNIKRDNLMTDLFQKLTKQK